MNYHCVFVKCTGEMSVVRIEIKPDEYIYSPTIIGAWPAKNLVLLGSSKRDFTKPLDCDLIKNSFNYDIDDLYDNMLIVKTDDNGDPIDCNLSDL